MAQSILIIYGSQTGNAQDVAERMGRECKQLGFMARVLAMDGYPITELPQEKVVLFVVSTTGQGDVPDNMRKSWRFLLRKSLPPHSLVGLLYAVFGLGDSGYVKYNIAAKKLDRRLASLGAAPLIERGLGDDQHPTGYEGELDPWLQRLWPALLEALPPPPATLQQLPAGAGQPPPQQQQLLGSCKYRVRQLPEAMWKLPSTEQLIADAVEAAAAFRIVQAYASGMPPSTSQPTATGGATFGPWRPFMAPMLRNTRITPPSHFQDTRHIELDLRGSGLEGYSPGDILSIFPSPPGNAVEEFLQRLGWRGDAMVEVEAVDPPVPVPAGVSPPRLVASLRAIAQGVLDVCGASPRRYLFQVLHHFSAAAMEADKLQYFASAEGRDDLYKYNQREGRTVLEVLTDFRSAQPPLEWLLEAAPLLQPRMFSLASSPLAHPGQAHITLAVVDYTTPYKRKKRGLCSNWLAGLQPGTEGEAAVKVPVWVESGVLKLPASQQVPMLMVGPGTGVAPFRSFLWQRHAHAADALHPVPGQAPPSPSPPPSSMLFFGCRSQTADFYYEQEWRQLQEAGVLDADHGLVTAFSRDQASKIYVQDRIREHGPAVWRLLEAGAVVYVCGSAQKMPAAVATALEAVVRQEGGMSGEEAAKWVRHLELTGRYFVEAWS